MSVKENRACNPVPLPVCNDKMEEHKINVEPLLKLACMSGLSSYSLLLLPSYALWRLNINGCQLNTRKKKMRVQAGRQCYSFLSLPNSSYIANIGTTFLLYVIHESGLEKCVKPHAVSLPNCLSHITIYLIQMLIYNWCSCLEIVHVSYLILYNFFPSSYCVKL